MTFFFLFLCRSDSGTKTKDRRMAAMNSLSFALFTLCMLLPCLVVHALANCPSSCECNDDTLVVTCGQGGLDVLPIALNPSITRLIIKNNKIKTIDSSIQFYAQLVYMDLSYNHLFNIPGQTFAYQKKLTELHLNHNKVGSISNRTFIGLESLTILNLRGNFLDELDNNVFQMLKKLEELNLGQNRINKIEPKAFEGLQNLRVLYLDDNNLNVVDPKILSPLSTLAELFLGINSFSTIPKDAFKELQGLNRLDLQGAALANITLGSFTGLVGLRILDLSDNRLIRVPTEELRQLSRLEELSLGQNDFESIPNNAFEGLLNLKEIRITGSTKLKRVESEAFATNGNLESITIASNKALVDVQDGLLNGLTHLKSVILKDNALSTLNEGRFSWNDLDVFDVSENPFVCDCKVLWLKNVLSGRNASSGEGTVICAAPESLRGEPLVGVSSDLPGCHHTDPKKQAMIGALLVTIAAIATALALLVFRCRKRIWEFLKGGFGNGEKKRKEREYQKTFSDEEFMARNPHVLRTTLNNCDMQASAHIYDASPCGVRAIPVTEL